MMVYALVHASKAILGMSIIPCDVNVIVLGKYDLNAGVIITQEVACMNVCDIFHPVIAFISDYNIVYLALHIGGLGMHCLIT